MSGLRPWVLWAVWGVASGCALVGTRVPVSAFASAAENHVLARFVAEARALSLARQLSTLDGAHLVFKRGSAGAAIVVDEPQGGFGGSRAVVEPFRDGWRATAIAERTSETVAAMEALQVRQVVASATAESAASAALIARMRAMRELVQMENTDRGEGVFNGTATLLRIDYEFSSEVFSAAGGHLEQQLHRATVTLWGVAKLNRSGNLSADDQANVAELVAMEHATAWEWDKALPAIDQVLAMRPNQVAYGLLKVAGLLALAKGQPAGAALEAVVGAAGGENAEPVRRAHARLRDAVGEGAWTIVNLALVARAELLAQQNAGRASNREQAGNAIISIDRSASPKAPGAPTGSPPTDTAVTVVPETAPSVTPPATAVDDSPVEPAKPTKASRRKKGRKR